MNQATYSPEDNKLRLYVGRVPRDEYDALRAGRWLCTPKQDCDFAAVWTPEREDVALSYGDGYIGDEDQSPTDRAADRAERFTGYLDKRRAEAHGHADSYDSGPRVHGMQNAAKAERAAARHDRQADRALTQWSKAEYWDRRTAGVISHALHVSSPGVRMGRIKKLEAEARRQLTPRWQAHIELRLAYERQMLEAQGGTAASIDIEAGGRWLGMLIIKANKSTVTGRVVSIRTKAKRVERWTYRVDNVIGCDFALEQIKVEREPISNYSAPTDEDLAELKDLKAQMSKARGKVVKPKLINPTTEDAARLQEIWNERAKRTSMSQVGEVRTMTQKQYSAMSKGSYSRAGTIALQQGGRQKSTHYSQRAELPAVVKVRYFSTSVVILSDKPQKPLASFLEDPRPAIEADVLERFEELQEICGRSWCDEKWTDDEKALLHSARIVGIAYQQSMTQFGLKEKGVAIARERMGVNVEA